MLSASEGKQAFRTSNETVTQLAMTTQFVVLVFQLIFSIMFRTSFFFIQVSSLNANVSFTYFIFRVVSIFSLKKKKEREKNNFFI